MMFWLGSQKEADDTLRVIEESLLKGLFKWYVKKIKNKN